MSHDPRALGDEWYPSADAQRREAEASDQSTTAPERDYDAELAALRHQLDVAHGIALPGDVCDGQPGHCVNGHHCRKCCSLSLPF